MRGILGKKVGMARIFDAEGKAIPVTVIKVGPCVVTGLRTEEKHGYQAVQVGFEEVTKVKNVIKPVLGQFEKIKVKPQRFVREIRDMNPSEFEVGQQIYADIFKEGDKVDVQGTSIGKGFAGAMKRHNFSGGGASHGSTVHRRPCSAGATDAARTFKGKRSPGHMGARITSVQRLEIVKVDKENNMMLIRGAVPGPRNSMLMIRDTSRATKRRRPRIIGTQNK